MNNEQIEKRKLRKREYYLKNKEHFKKLKKEYYLKNKETFKKKRREYYKNNKDLVLLKEKKYQQKNKDKIKKRKSDYYLKNCKSIKFKAVEYRRNKRTTSKEFRLFDNLRSRIRIAIVKNTSKKSKRTEELIGASITKVREYIERQFKEGMSWDNYGKKGWHLDHIKPCASFDLSDPEQQRQCFNYSNLQPLWWWENLKKSDNL